MLDSTFFCDWETFMRFGIMFYSFYSLIRKFHFSEGVVFALSGKLAGTQSITGFAVGVGCRHPYKVLVGSGGVQLAGLHRRRAEGGGVGAVPKSNHLARPVITTPVTATAPLSSS